MGSLKFVSDIDDARLNQKLTQIGNNIDQVGRDALKSGSMVDKAFSDAEKATFGFSTSLGNVKSQMLGLASVASLGYLIKDIVSVRGEWQKYEAVLTNTLGSNEEAVESLKMISEYGAKTNFQVNELTDSFSKLASQGFEPTRSEMQKLGDLAASKAKSFNQLTEALIDAETFEFERLKEFGIRASKNGDQIIFTFKGIKTEVDASAESIRNYILSLGNLDGVKGSTDAIAKTLVGLTSNFEDAWDQMLNKLGKSQEGLFANSISAATSLVNNYEKVLDALGVLVVTYGAYKAAVIAATVVEKYRASTVLPQNAWNIYANTAAQNSLTFSQWAGVRATTALNAAWAANPVGIVVAGVGLLVSALVLFSKKAKETEDYIDSLNESIENLGKQAETDKLVARYDELKEKTNKTKEEQDELNNAIQLLSKIFPGAISKTDEYGKAIELAYDKLVLMNEETREQIKLNAQKQVGDSESQLSRLQSEKEILNEELKAGYRNVKLTIPGQGTVNRPVALDEGDKQKIMARLQAIGKEIESLAVKSVEAENTISAIGQIDKEQFIKSNSALFKSVENMSKEQLLETKNSLEKLLVYENPKAIEESIVKQIDIINSQLNLPTVMQRLEAAKKEYTAAKAKLDELSAPESQATDKQIQQQQDIVTALEKKLGIKKKEKDSVDELKKAEEALTEAVKTGSLTAINEAAKRVAALQTEKDKLQEIADLAVFTAKYADDNKNLSKIQGKSVEVENYVGKTKTVATTTGKKIIYEIVALDKSGPVWKKVGLESDNLKGKITENAKQTASDQKQLDDDEARRKEQFYGDLLNYSRQFTNELIDQLGLSEELNKVMKGTADVAFNLLSGNFLGAAFSGISTIIGMISGQYKEAKKNIDDLKDAMLIFESIDKARSELNNKDWVEYTELQLTELSNKISDAIKIYDPFGFGDAFNVSKIKIALDYYRTISEMQGGLTEGQQKQLDQFIEWETKYNQLQEESWNKITGTTRDAVAESIIEGFRSGSNTGADIMKNAVIEAFKNNLIEGNLTEWYKGFAEAGNDGFTKEEIDYWQAKYQEMIAMQKQQWDNIEKVTGINPNNTNDSQQSGLTGSIQNLTEETGGLIAGQAMAMRVDLKSIADSTKLIQNQFEIMDQSLGVLQNIEKNTRHNARLNDVVERLDKTNKLLEEGL